MSQRRNSSDSFLDMSNSQSSSLEQSAYIQNLTESSEDEYSLSSDECTVPIRTRQRFKPEEISILEHHYQACAKPSTDVKKQIAQRLNTQDNRIQIWFQNRRAKEKKPDTRRDGEQRNEDRAVDDDACSCQVEEKQSSSNNSSRPSSQNQSQQPHHPFIRPYSNTVASGSSQSFPGFDLQTREKKRYKTSNDDYPIGRMQDNSSEDSYYLHKDMYTPYSVCDFSMYTIDPSEIRSFGNRDHTSTQMPSESSLIYGPDDVSSVSKPTDLFSAVADSVEEIGIGKRKCKQ